MHNSFILFEKRLIFWRRALSFQRLAPLRTLFFSEQTPLVLCEHSPDMVAVHALRHCHHHRWQRLPPGLATNGAGKGNADRRFGSGSLHAGVGREVIQMPLILIICM